LVKQIPIHYFFALGFRQLAQRRRPTGKNPDTKAAAAGRLVEYNELNSH
jgi:hypothetical protein